MRFETELQNEWICKCWGKKNLPQEQNGNGSQHCPHTDQSVNLWALPRTPVASSHFLQHKKKRNHKTHKKFSFRNEEQNGRLNWIFTLYSI